MKALLIIISLLFMSSLSTVSGQESTASAGGDVSKTIDYDLPYPGILPTSPIYPFKMLRDRIIGYLIADPLKKAEFSLLQADKRLQGGVSLLLKDKSKADIAISTISKGENYFAEAFDETLIAKKQKREIYDMAVKLSVAARKHEEVLMSIEKSVPQNQKRNYEKELKRVREYIRRVKPLMLRE